jgi:hypothetical protein
VVDQQIADPSPRLRENGEASKDRQTPDNLLKANEPRARARRNGERVKL